MRSERARGRVEPDSSGVEQISGVLVEKCPRARDMPFAGTCVTYRQPQRESPVDAGVRQEHLSRGVHRVQQPFVQRVELVFRHTGWMCAKADHAERNRGEPLESRTRVHPLRKPAGKLQVR